MTQSLDATTRRPSPDDPAASGTSDTRRSPAALASLGAVFLLVFATLIALGTWQVHRLSWKLALIALVDARVHAAPAPPPGPSSWPGLTAADDEYRHVAVKGAFRNDRETDVQAVTELGAGSWILTPFTTDKGFTVLVNRGFVPPALRNPAERQAGQPSGETTVTGLLRMSEPKGAFLRRNDSSGNRWFSRDVAAIAAARNLGPVAPYFIDADASPNPGGYPVGGLTVISFPNNHLVYAVTWYTLAAMLAGVAFWVIRDETRLRGSRQAQ